LKQERKTPAMHRRPATDRPQAPKPLALSGGTNRAKGSKSKRSPPPQRVKRPIPRPPRIPKDKKTVAARALPFKGTWGKREKAAKSPKHPAHQAINTKSKRSKDR
jgi:hypothetical protein